MRNKQKGKVQIWNPASLADPKAPNVVDISELAFITDLTAATTKAALLLAIGIPTYVDETAANVALNAGDLYYDSTLVKFRLATA